jgi:bacterioferritin
MGNIDKSSTLLEMLNEALAREIQVSVQYMWQHVLWKGVAGFAVKDELKRTAITEMKHAEAIAERIAYLGGRPTTKPTPIFVGETLKEMLEQDKKDEEGAIQLYKRIIEEADKAEDKVTKKLMTDILADEEDHHGTFSGLLEEL